VISYRKHDFVSYCRSEEAGGDPPASLINASIDHHAYSTTKSLLTVQTPGAFHAIRAASSF
jgi:hypothetical protein